MQKEEVVPWYDVGRRFSPENWARIAGISIENWTRDIQNTNHNVPRFAEAGGYAFTVKYRK